MRPSLLLIAVLAACAAPDTHTDEPALPVIGLLDHADMTIGTGGNGINSSNSHPAATLPWGMVQVGPDSASSLATSSFDHASGFHARDDLILGFSHTRPQGTSTPDTGAVLIMPSTGAADALVTGEGRRRAFVAGSLVATPGRVQITLDQPEIDVDLTATVRAAHHRYTFPPGTQTARLALAVGYGLAGITVRDAHVELDPSGQTLQGWVTFGGRFSSHSSLGAGQTTWFAARVDRPFTGHTFSGGVLGDDLTVQGSDCGAVLEIAAGDDPVVELQLAISYVDQAGALANLAAELPSWDLEATADAARVAWSEMLGPIRVSDEDPRRVRILAAALTRSFLMPYRYQDADGRYRGFDDQLHHADFAYHSAFSMWDTYRTTHPLIEFLHPERQADMNASLVQMAREGGYLPRWPWGNGYTNVTVGTSADIVLADSLVKGVGGFDPVEALAFSRKAAEAPTPPGHPFAGREGITESLALGYVPRDVTDRSVTRTEEYAVADAGIAVLAAAVGDEETAAAYRTRARGYASLWRPEYQAFAPRLSDGSWAEPFDVTSYQVQDSYYGANARQYAWMAPHDPEGLIDLYGGPGPFVDALQAFFEDAKVEFADDVPLLGIVPPVTYYQGNEPDIHAPFLFGAAGRPDLTWRYATWVAERFYDDTVEGIVGNEDSGAMSSWYVWASLGLYPVVTTDRYLLGRPLFERVEVDVPGGLLVIEAPPLPDAEAITPRVTWNDEPWTETTIPHALLLGGGVLRFER